MNYTEYIEWLDANLKSQTVITEKDCVFNDVTENPFDLYGFCDPKKNGFVRVPPDTAKELGAGMEFFGKNTAGGRVRFSTNSKYVALKVVMPEMHLRNMSFSGSAGFDLFIDGKKGGKFYKIFIPPFGFKDEWREIIYFPNAKQRYLTINFPLYSIVEKVGIGIQKSATLGHGKEYSRKTPIVFYGGSHVQGASATKPGNAASHLIGRYFDSDFINLGFSGNALGERRMAEYIAGLNASLLIMEYDHNAPSAEYLEKTHYPFYETVRKANPDLPIVMVSKHDFYTCSYYVKTQSENVARRAAVIRSYERAKKNGDKRVYFLDGKNLLSGDYREDCTVDGTHPNDLGFYRIAKKYIDFIKKNHLI